jgi:hypothetical protein
MRGSRNVPHGQANPLDTTKAPHILFHLEPRWRNWQTHYFEVVAGQPVQVQILSWAYGRLFIGVGLFVFREDTKALRHRGLRPSLSPQFKLPSDAAKLQVFRPTLSRGLRPREAPKSLRPRKIISDYHV